MIKEGFTSDFDKLNTYCKERNFCGPDPYDFLNSRKFKFLQKYKFSRLLMTQFFKLSPLNLRNLFSTKQTFDPKAISLFIIAQCNMYEVTNDRRYLQISQALFFKLMQLKVQNNFLWGAGFDYHIDFLNKKTDISSVSSAFAGLAVLKLYKLTNSDTYQRVARKIVESIFQYLSSDSSLFYFLYRGQNKDFIYNSNALIISFLAKAEEAGISFKKTKLLSLIDIIIDEKETSGFWRYNRSTGHLQLDYHQGFMIDMLIDLLDTNLYTNKDKIEKALHSSINFYKDSLFLKSGVSLYRYPKEKPVDIHNQAQGIITFSRSSKYIKDNLFFAQKILEWTNSHMKDRKGYYYYQKGNFITNRIPYMRWSQSWMCLAISEYINQSSNFENE